MMMITKEQHIHKIISSYAEIYINKINKGFSSLIYTAEILWKPMIKAKQRWLTKKPKVKRSPVNFRLFFSDFYTQKKKTLFFFALLDILLINSTAYIYKASYFCNLFFFFSYFLILFYLFYFFLLLVEKKLKDFWDKQVNNNDNKKRCQDYKL